MWFGIPGDYIFLALVLVGVACYAPLPSFVNRQAATISLLMHSCCYSDGIGVAMVLQVIRHAVTTLCMQSCTACERGVRYLGPIYGTMGVGCRCRVEPWDLSCLGLCGLPCCVHAAATQLPGQASFITWPPGARCCKFERVTLVVTVSSSRESQIMFASQRATMHRRGLFASWYIVPRSVHCGLSTITVPCLTCGNGVACEDQQCLSWPVVAVSSGQCGNGVVPTCVWGAFEWWSAVGVASTQQHVDIITLCVVGACWQGL